ncbi:Brain mitochondrial carrier protein 1, partial [Bienertia sinuspersici]
MIKTRSSQHELLYYDPEIKRTLRRIRKEQRKIQVDLEFNLEKLFKEESNMAERTLKELGVPKLDDEPLYIARVCGICSYLSHTTDACPTLQTEDVNALGGWRDHPNLRYGPKPPFPQTTNSRPYAQHNFQPAPSNSSSLEDRHTSLSNLESQLSGKLPSQPHPNPKEQVNRVILREPEGANEFKELEVISEESNNTIKLLDAINVVPKYQMLFEQYLSNNDIHDSDEFSKEWLSSLPVKCKDPGSFSIPCRISKHCYRKCMLDLGSSIGVDNLETIIDGMVAE